MVVHHRTLLYQRKSIASKGFVDSSDLRKTELEKVTEQQNCNKIFSNCFKMLVPCDITLDHILAPPSRMYSGTGSCNQDGIGSVVVATVGLNLYFLLTTVLVLEA